MNSNTTTTPTMRRRMLLCLLLTITLTMMRRVSGQDFENPLQPSTGGYFYTLFESDPSVLYTPLDGPSGVGVFCKPGMVGTRGPNKEVIFPDMCSGASIRNVTSSGIGRLTGSFTQVGNVDGSREEALLGGSTSGAKDGAITWAYDAYYYSDAVYNVVRNITEEGTVGTYIGKDSIQVASGGTSLNKPLSLTTYTNRGTDYLLVSDTGNARTIYVTLTNSGGVPTVFSDLNDIRIQALTTGNDQNTIYYVTSEGAMGAMNMVTAAKWSIGDVSTNAFDITTASLVYSNGELFYLGDSGRPVLAIDATEKAEGAAPATPRTVLTWPDELQGSAPELLIAREINNENPKNSDNFYVVTTRSVYIVSDSPVYPDQNTTDGGPYDSRRAQGIGAYPMNSLPTSNPCFMSEVYQAMREDVETALLTTDYYSEYVPLGNIDYTVLGTYNVSTWCGNITGDKSYDSTIEILPYRGPLDLSQPRLRDALRNSPWTRTRELLDHLNTTNSGLNLQPFCFIDCATLDTCRQMTYNNPNQCYDPNNYNGGPYDLRRAQGIGAYPMNSLPVNDSCLLSEVYQAMREDVEKSLSTTNYYSEYVPLGNIDYTVLGTYNVSTWCGNITGDKSYDSTIEILPYRGPLDLSQPRLRDALRNSPWTRTRELLDHLNTTNSGLNLQPFCFIDCATLQACREMTYDNPDQCYVPNTDDEGGCDDICKGAIAASVVLGAAGVVLIVLLIIAPANLFTALVMVPIV